MAYVMSRIAGRPIAELGSLKWHAGGVVLGVPWLEETTMSGHRAKLVLVAALFGAALSFPVQPVRADQETFAGETRDSSGLAILPQWTGPSPYQFGAKNDKEADTYNRAYDEAMKNPNDLGYPWLDTATGKLTRRGITAKGLSLAESSVTTMGLDAGHQEIASGKASIAKLDAIADQAIQMRGAGVPGNNLIWRTWPDQLHSRVIITISELNEDLLAHLASVFGTDLIAISVMPGGPGEQDSRNQDSTRFWGGAEFYSGVADCTTGFSWWVATGVYGMLTAGHCAYNGGSVSNGYYQYPKTIGNVTSGAEENWDPNNGTVYFNGQTTYRGDLALIRINSGYGSSPYVYTGGNNDGQTITVGFMHSGWTRSGEQVCFSGRITNNWCGQVYYIDQNRWYIVNGLNVYARHVVQADAMGNTCPTHGDSGGPIYQTASNGKAIAVGIFSGSFPQIINCSIYFTDIWDAFWGLPGWLMEG
jgi:hypothetical protein